MNILGITPKLETVLTQEFSLYTREGEKIRLVS